MSASGLLGRLRDPAALVATRRVRSTKNGIIAKATARGSQRVHADLSGSLSASLHVTRTRSTSTYRVTEVVHTATSIASNVTTVARDRESASDVAELEDSR